MNARAQYDTGNDWTDNMARLALPILLMMARNDEESTYEGLCHEIHRRYNPAEKCSRRNVRHALFKIGRMLNQLSDEWKETIPPLTILILSATTGLPSEGVDEFLEPYVQASLHKQLTPANRQEAAERAIAAVHNYRRWPDVAAYFGIRLPKTIDTEPIPLPGPGTITGPEGDAHRSLKQFIAEHPERFAKIGVFGPGKLEVRLDSGDEIDVLFENDEIALAIEVKTADAPPAELTRGIYQCVKYRAVLRAMYTVAGKLVNVQVMLVSPQPLPPGHAEAARRLHVPFGHVKQRIAEAGNDQPVHQEASASNTMSADTKALEARFHQAMLDAFRTAKQQTGYNATYFLQLVQEHGGVQAAKRLLAKEEISEGLAYMFSVGRPDLTMEALVLQPEYNVLFTPEELAMARRHLGREQ